MINQLIRNFLRDHILFREYANDEFIDSLVTAMKPRVFVDGAYIIRKGEMGKAMFFNLKGIVEVISEDGNYRLDKGETVQNVMGEGSFFGEIGVLYSVPRSRGKSIILTLTKESLDATLKPYPLIEKSIALIAEERYSTHLKKKESMLIDKFGEELTACITQNELQNVFIFKDADSEFLHRLAITLVPVQFFQNQIIMKKGDIANAMYFLVKGTVQAVDEYSTKVFATFEPGSFFGEIGLLMKNTTRTATIKCASPDVLVFMCEKKNLDRIIEDYPDMKKKIEAEMYRRYEYVRHRDNEEADTGATDFESIREKLKKVALFKNASGAFVHEIALKVVLKRGQPGDVIVRHGDSANSMFFIVDGIVQIASADRSKVFAEMSTDSYFGEVSLFFDQRRTATVICKSETTLVELGKDAVDATFLMYPDLKETIASVAAENYKAYCKRERISADSVVSGMISFEATAEHLKAIPMFKSCDLTFLRDLAARTIVQVLQKGAIVVKEGDSSNEMFFVVEGEVEILSRDLGTCYDKIQAGGFFGEVGILHGWKRNATVRAFSEKVILILISAKTLSNTLEAFPESIEAIAISCENRIAKAKQRNEISNAELASSQALLNIKPKQVAVIGMVYQNERIRERQKQKNSLNNFKLNTKNLKERSISAYSEDTFNVSGPHKLVNITQCSPEELRIILRNISIDCKLKLRRVCKVFDQRVHEQAFWTELKFDQISRILNSQIFFNFVGLAGDFLKVVDLSVCDTLTDDEVVVLVAECPNITHFNSSKCWKLTDKSLAAITKNLLNLTILNISCCSKIRGSGFANHNIKKLLELNISYCKQISDKNVEHLLSNTPLLRIIYLNRCQRLTEFGIFLIARFCRDIEHIHLEDCEQFTDRCMKWLRTFCIKITTINFKFCRGFTSAGFKLLGDSNLNLEYLNLSFCLAVSDSTIKEFKRTFQNLKVLRLQQCSKITDSIGLHLARNAPKLQILDIRGCPYTTSDGLQQLFESLNVQVKILSDIKPEKRGIVQPGHPTKPKLQELLLSDVFLNYPKECSFRSTENIHGSIIEHMNLRKFAKAKVKLAMKKDKKIEQENLIGLE